MDITEDPAALLRWMVAGPEVARVVDEFMAHQEGIINGKEHLHHDQSPSIHIWGQCLVPSPDYSAPQQWGWSRSGDEETTLIQPTTSIKS